MSDPAHVIGCCGKPTTCHSTQPCSFRETFRQVARNTDVQANTNAVTQGSLPEPTCENRGHFRGPGNKCVFCDEPILAKQELDPNGLNANAPGAKLDAGKVRVGLVMAGFARALMEVAKVGTAGANKYTPNGWMEVPNGIERYTDARDRHQLKEYMGEEVDPDFGYLHAAHECWNSLARLDLMLRAKEANKCPTPVI
jgi:hypothetical protein